MSAHRRAPRPYRAGKRPARSVDLAVKHDVSHEPRDPATGQWVVSPANIVQKWHEATEGERVAGRDWYPAAHRTALALSKRYNVSKEEAAGLLATYSPQTPWGRNQVEASETLRYGHGVGGPKAAVWFSHQAADQPNTLEDRVGIMATGVTRKLADEVLTGEDFDVATAGRNKNGSIPPKALKIRSFYHLIAQGGNTDPAHPYVVIDRHAMSVAFGKRVTEEDYTRMHPGSGAKYQPFVDAYVQAAKEISAEEGRTVDPAEVQAATWLVQQRENAAQSTRVGKTRKALGNKDWNEWTTYAARYLGMDTETGAQVGYTSLAHTYSRVIDLANADLPDIKRAGRSLRAGKGAATTLRRLGVSPKVARATLSLVDRGTAHRPNARLQGHDRTLPITIERDREILYRGAYLINSAKRIQAAVDGGKTLAEAVKAEAPYQRMHERARRARLESVTAAQRIAKQFGQKTPEGNRTLVGWYLNPLLDNDEECKIADGHNFLAEEGTDIGYPGGVHMNCGCVTGPPIEGAGMVNDALRGVIRLPERLVDTTAERKYPLSRKRTA